MRYGTVPPSAVGILEKKIAQDFKFVRTLRPDTPPEGLAKLVMQRVMNSGWGPDWNSESHYKQLFEDALNDLVLLRAENEELKCQARQP